MNYSNFDEDHFIDFQRVQCREIAPSITFGVYFSIISTNNAAKIAIVSS